MQKQSALHSNALFTFRTSSNRPLNSRASSTFSSSIRGVTRVRLCLKRVRLCVEPVKFEAAYGDQGETSDEDEDLCPVECVREIKTDDELFRILDKAKETKALVVVDFFRTSCGSCKYIEQGFAKLCRGAGDEEASVIFLKHNVLDEYDEQSEIAERLRIKSVPLFHFYKDGALMEAFATRDKGRITEAIRKYTNTS